MATAVLVIGMSGSGKSASLRNFPGEEYGLINVLDKELPFKTKKKWVSTTNYGAIKQTLVQYAERVDAIVIDDAGYAITDQFISNHGASKGNAVFELFNDLAKSFYNLIRFIKVDLPKDKIVYVFMHEDRSDLGYVKPKTIGKMLDEKIDIAGMFTIVLNAAKKDGKYIFKTQTDGYDVTKSPIGMFQGPEIPNDLYEVHKAIRLYNDEEVVEKEEVYSL